ncbi:MAG: hypothetical protein IKZ86_01210 [Spirochaetaceae bacterium]|nr:hypothetical protein [Spirochaetaceae bacterium]
MSDITNAVNSFQKMLDIEYEFVLGRKNKSINLTVEFQKMHFFHLAGLQHLNDLPRLAFSAEVIFDRLKSNIITPEYIESSIDYKFIKKRIEYLPLLEKIFDSNDTIFRYNPALQTFSVIEADFLMKNTVKNTNLFVFLSKGNNDKYFCKSFFPENKTDYAERQTRWTVLLKKKKLRNENNEEILYKHPNLDL